MTATDAARGDPPIETTLFELIEDGIAVLTLHAPKKRNALSTPVRTALQERLEEAMGDPAIRAVVLAGHAGIFSAGGDISAMGQPLEQAMARLHLLHDTVRLILRGPKPVVAAVSGPAFGAGWSLALASDWVVADETARFSAAFARLGLMPDCGILWTLPQRVGQRRAIQHLMRADILDADAALASSVVDEVVPGDPLVAAVERARELSSLAPLSIARIKRYYADESLDAALLRESEAQRALFQTEDHLEAVAAFRARRQADFKGR